MKPADVCIAVVIRTMRSQASTTTILPKIA
jgi:hypothetical protein